MAPAKNLGKASANAAIAKVPRRKQISQLNAQKIVILFAKLYNAAYRFLKPDIVKRIADMFGASEVNIQRRFKAYCLDREQQQQQEQQIGSLDEEEYQPLAQPFPMMYQQLTRPSTLTPFLEEFYNWLFQHYADKYTLPPSFVDLNAEVIQHIEENAAKQRVMTRLLIIDIICLVEKEGRYTAAGAMDLWKLVCKSPKLITESTQQAEAAVQSYICDIYEPAGMRSFTGLELRTALKAVHDKLLCAPPPMQLNINTMRKHLSYLGAHIALVFSEIDFQRSVDEPKIAETDWYTLCLDISKEGFINSTLNAPHLIDYSEPVCSIVMLSKTRAPRAPLSAFTTVQEDHPFLYYFSTGAAAMKYYPVLYHVRECGFTTSRTNQRMTLHFALYQIQQHFRDLHKKELNNPFLHWLRQNGEVPEAMNSYLGDEELREDYRQTEQSYMREGDCNLLTYVNDRMQEQFIQLKRVRQEKKEQRKRAAEERQLVTRELRASVMQLRQARNKAEEEREEEEEEKEMHWSL
jgi:hypothetical protein